MPNLVNILYCSQLPCWWWNPGDLVLSRSWLRSWECLWVEQPSKWGLLISNPNPSQWVDWHYVTPSSPRGPRRSGYSHEAHLLGNILSCRVTEIVFYPTPQFWQRQRVVIAVVASPSALDNNKNNINKKDINKNNVNKNKKTRIKIKIKITRIKITRIKRTRIKRTRIK